MTQDPSRPPVDVCSPEREPIEEDPFTDMEEVDPILEACLLDALSPFARALPPEQLAEHRAFLTDFIKIHPLYERLRGRPEVLAQSGIVLRGGAAATQATRASRGGSRR